MGYGFGGGINLGTTLTGAMMHEMMGAKDLTMENAVVRVPRWHFDYWQYRREIERSATKQAEFIDRREKCERRDKEFYRVIEKIGRKAGLCPVFWHRDTYLILRDIYLDKYELEFFAHARFTWEGTMYRAGALQGVGIVLPEKCLWPLKL